MCTSPAIAVITGSSMIFGSVACPSGANASSTIPCSRQKSRSSHSGRYGWGSTSTTAGLIRATSTISRSPARRSGYRTFLWGGCPRQLRNQYGRGRGWSRCAHPRRIRRGGPRPPAFGFQEKLRDLVVDHANRRPDCHLFTRAGWVAFEHDNTLPTNSPRQRRRSAAGKPALTCGVRSFFTEGERTN